MIVTYNSVCLKGTPYEILLELSKLKRDYTYVKDVIRRSFH